MKKLMQLQLVLPRSKETSVPNCNRPKLLEGKIKTDKLKPQDVRPLKKTSLFWQTTTKPRMGNSLLL